MRSENELKILANDLPLVLYSQILQTSLRAILCSWQRMETFHDIKLKRINFLYSRYRHKIHSEFEIAWIEKNNKEIELLVQERNLLVDSMEFLKAQVKQSSLTENTRSLASETFAAIQDIFGRLIQIQNEIFVRMDNWIIFVKNASK